MRYADGRLGRCDAHCQTHPGRRCSCVCGGVYHGAGEWGPGLAAVVEDLHAVILSGLGIREHRGELRILAWRETLGGPLVRRQELAAAPRTDQLPLAYTPAPVSEGAPHE